MPSKYIYLHFMTFTKDWETESSMDGIRLKVVSISWVSGRELVSLHRLGSETEILKHCRRHAFKVPEVSPVRAGLTVSPPHVPHHVPAVHLVTPPAVGSILLTAAPPHLALAHLHSRKGVMPSNVWITTQTHTHLRSGPAQHSGVGVHSVHV